MKNLILIFILVSVHFTCQAQFDKGTIQLGFGGLPVIYTDNSLEAGYSVRANLGYFPVNRLAIGVMPFSGKVEDMKSIGASLYLRYYLTTNRTALFMETGTGFSNLKYQNTPQYNGTMSSFNIGPGIHYNLKNKLAIELILQYARLRNTTHNEDTRIGNTFIPTLGIQYFLWK